LKYILDTNIISELSKQNPNKNVVSFINSLDENLIYLSVVTIGEINFGIEKLQNTKKKDELHEWLYKDLLSRFQNRLLDIGIDTMLSWGSINSHLKAIGKPMPIMDSLIGATCQTRDYILITRNEKDFINLDIETINPFN